MKPFSLFFCVLISLSILGCKDINDVEADGSGTTNTSETQPAEKSTGLESDNPDSGFVVESFDDEKSSSKPANAAVPYKKYFYPFERTITDAKNRTIEAEIVAKRGDQIAFKKQGAAKEFIVSISALSQADQDFFNDLDPGGDFQAAVERVERGKRLEGRRAVWHRDLGAVERESDKLDLPMLVMVLVYNHEKNTELRNVFFSEQFRDWANLNVCLCVLEVDDPRTRTTSSGSAKANRESARRLGLVNFGFPIVLLARGTHKHTFTIGDLTEPKSTIWQMEKAIGNMNNWQVFTPSFER